VSLRLRALELHLPGWVARSAVRSLFDATAAAFDCGPVDVHGLEHPALLERYASFTAAAAEHALAEGPDPDAVSRRMWRNAYDLGESLRRRIGVRTREEALRAARIASRMIGIDLRAATSGGVVVERCAFADRYSPPVCHLMSSLDAGLIAGLTEGGRLTFSERITEGKPRCLARISWGGATS
jgi:hypothetical protein